MSEFFIRKADAEDVSEIANIESLCFKSPWTEAMIASEMAEPLAHFYCGILGGKIICYYGFLHIADELHILNVAVSPMYQHCGYGKAMLAHLDTVMALLEARAATLEVRESNQPAISLYEKSGFECAGVRPHYYMDKENALIYWKEH